MEENNLINTKTSLTSELYIKMQKFYFVHTQIYPLVFNSILMISLTILSYFLEQWLFYTCIALLGVVIVCNIIVFFTYKTNVKKNCNIDDKNYSYTYTFMSDMLKCNIQGSDVSSDITIKYSDIDRVLENNEMFLLVYNKIVLYPIDKKDMTDQEILDTKILLSACKIYKRYEKNKTPKKTKDSTNTMEENKDNSDNDTNSDSENK